MQKQAESLRETKRSPISHAEISRTSDRYLLNKTEHLSFRKTQNNLISHTETRRHVAETNQTP